ncbi:structure-specific endonuclease subunit SLX1 isoform X2 [Prunus persica]|uniref:structure-specific endonuclease subunit SLX1 isoform X2 n=1 Tax=Prunus persica TaxID=3760 RepID=UPI0009AB20A8|nr:structure-specific endonuclease subunit SLX1 isoform X2 [Prunus persica]
MLVKKSYRTKSTGGLPYSPQTISQHQQWCQSCLLSLHAVRKPSWSAILLLHYKYKKSALNIPGLLKLSIYIRNLHNYKFLHYLSANNHKCRLLIYEIPETLIAEEEEAEEGRFFACYLLSSRSPRYKGHTYIRFTVNPRRRIRQHNGEIAQGAWRTKRKRPWEMVLCIYGFPTNVSALQHQTVSKAVRQAAASFKSPRGLVSKIKLAYTMLTLPPWQSLNITVKFFSTQYTKHSAGCPRLPEQMKVKVCSMDELPSCTKPSDDLLENEDEWCHERECDEDMNSSTLPEETLLDQDS